MNPSLRRNNPAQCVTPGQDDAAVVDHRRWGGTLEIRYGWAGPLNQRPSAGWAPIGGYFQSDFCVAMAADAIHT
jgi:hypothetical protein